MNMPTLCDCGEVVEFDDMRGIGNELYCAECFEEMEADEG